VVCDWPTPTPAGWPIMRLIIYFVAHYIFY